MSQLRYGPEVEVKFNPPDPTVITLQGPALRAYEKWLEVPSWENEELLADAIYEQCEHFVMTWSTLDTWEVVN